MKVVTNILAFLMTVFLTTGAFAGDDPSIPTSEKDKIKDAMVNYIKSNSTAKGHLLVLDEKTKKTRKLKFDHVHKGVVKNHDGFLACVDMLDGNTVLDLDFTISKEDNEYKVSNYFIHKVDGKKRGGFFGKLFGK